MSQTPEENKVTQIVNDAKEREMAVDDSTRPQGPAPHLAPPGGGMFMGPRSGGGMQNDFTRQQLKDAIRQEALNKSADAVKGSSVDTQVKAYRVVDDYAYPNTAKQNDPNLKKGQEKGVDETQRSAMHQMGDTDMKTRHDKGKDLSESQDYAMRKLGDEKEKNIPKPQKESEPFKGASMSKSFSASLSYSKLNRSVDKGPQNKDSKQTMDMSGSSKFSSTLGYNNMSKGNKSTSLAKEIKTNGRDITKD